MSENIEFAFAACRIKLVEVDVDIKPKAIEEIANFLRVNKSHDGYVFLKRDNGSIVTGAYIKNEDLASKRLIPHPEKVLYYHNSKIYILFREDNREH